MPVKSLSVSVTTARAPSVVLVDAGQLLYHVVWPVSGTTGDLAASFGTRLAHYPPVSKEIILFDRYDQDAPSAKDHKRTRRRRAVLTQTPFFHAEKLFFTIARTRIYLTKLYAAIPFHTTSNSSTCWIVSLMIPTYSFSWCTVHQGCELSPIFKWKSGITMSWTSMKLFSG